MIRIVPHHKRLHPAHDLGGHRQLGAGLAERFGGDLGSTPSISNMMRPGLTSAMNPCGSPLPFPIFTSAGFCVKGWSGKMRIQTLPDFVA